MTGAEGLTTRGIRERIMMMTDSLDELSRRGVSVWLDGLSRQRLTTGSLTTTSKRSGR